MNQQELKISLEKCTVGIRIWDVINLRVSISPNGTMYRLREAAPGNLMLHSTSV